MKNKIVGYTTGVFDLFHIGHLNILEKAKENCDYLIVGVTTDEEVKRVKGEKPVIPFEERIKIVNAIKFVDNTYEENNVDKLKAWEILKFDRIFKGDDWKGSEKWNYYEEEFKKRHVEVFFFRYTQGTSSTKLKDTLQKLTKE